MPRIAPRVRTADDIAPAVPVLPPRARPGAYSWTLESIRSARDEQMRGVFATPARLAEAMRTDDALFTAFANRVAPHVSLATRLEPVGTGQGVWVARRAAAHVHVARSVLVGLAGTLANHGVAFGRVEREVLDDGALVEMRLTEWPIEHVRWDPSLECFQTATRGGGQVPIVHGDGTWIVVRAHAQCPWTQCACVLPGALVWAAHAEGVADLANATHAHGLAKIMGELPEGFALMRGDALSPEAQAYLDTLASLANGDSSAALQPSGAKTEFLTNGSSAWQVFDSLIANRERAAARIYLGTDATLGAPSGAPGVDIATLFGVATTRLQADIQALEDALATGLYAPWTALQYGDTRYAPRLVYELPDPDENARCGERSAAWLRLTSTLDAIRASGLVVDQELVADLAAQFGVRGQAKLVEKIPAM